MRSRQGAENPGVLCRPVVNLYDIIQGRVEEGELTEDHWKRDIQAQKEYFNSSVYIKVSRIILTVLTSKEKMDYTTRSTILSGFDCLLWMKGSAGDCCTLCG